MSKRAARLYATKRRSATPSKVYTMGYGHGLDGLGLRDTYGDQAVSEAYREGYRLGQQERLKKKVVVS